MTDKEIAANANLDTLNEYRVKIEDIDFAMYWHQDPGPEDNIVASFSLYLNDDFEGGELEFGNVPIKIKPKAGMLAVIPGGDKYKHKVNKVLGPNSRHTLYGNSFINADLAPVSTGDDC
jgi:hypothetical protein